MNFAAPRITASAAIPTRQVKVCSSFNVRQPRVGSMTVHQQSAMAAAPAIRPRLVATRFQAATGNGTAASYTPRTVPSDEALAIWKKADCVCFDVDCTVTVNDSLDLLAEFVGCGAEVEELTNKAMDGSMNLAKSLEIRLDILNCTPSDIRSFIKAHPPTSRLSPNIETLMKALQARGVDVYLISGGFREIILPVAAHLDVPADNIFANRMNWQWCDEVGEPAKLVGFDNSEPTSRNMGKVAAIKQIRESNTYNNVVMIGDGITDLEAVQATGGADLFIGYGGIVERPDVARQAEWFVYDHIELVEAFKKAPTAADAARIAGLPHPPKQGKPAKDDEDELGIPLRKPANKPVMAAVSPL